MAQQTFGRGAVIPPYMPGLANAPNTGTVSTAAVNEVAALICRAPKTGNVRAIWSACQVGTGANRDIGLYTVDATTGYPTAAPTAYAANSFATKAYVVGDSNKLQSSGSFGADCAVTKGAVLSVCWIAPGASAGSVDVLCYSDINAVEFPYRARYTAGAWGSKSPLVPFVMFEYSDGSYEIPLGCYCIGDASGNLFTTVTFNNGTNPNHQGARFSLPVPARCNGAWLLLDGDGNADIYLVASTWDGTSGAALAKASIDLDVRASTSPNVWMVEFDATVDLSANTNYRLLVVPSSATSLSIFYHAVKDATHMGALPLGTGWHFTTGNNPAADGDFTNYGSGTFRVPVMGLVLDGFSDGASAGGGLKLVGAGGLCG